MENTNWYDILLPFNSCIVKIKKDNGYLETVFEDETKVPALPVETAETFWTAKDLGYETDLKRMTIDHEILHTFLCESCGLEFSPTLWSVAHQIEYIPLYSQYEEEALVLSFQKYLNIGKIDPVVDEFVKRTKLDLRKLKKQSKELLDFTNE